MRQIVLTRRGGPEVLVVRDVPVPEPGPQDVVVRTSLAGVNFADVMARLGLHPDSPRPPCVPGYELAGTIVAAGAAVPAQRIGQRVAVICAGGGYSEYVRVPAALAFPVGPGVSDEAAAALPLNYLTALVMLHVLAPVQPGDRVLVHSAAGGVGQAACQLVWRAGATVLASASPFKHDLLRSQGATLVVDSRAPRFAAAVRDATSGRGVDIVLEPRHGRWILESYRALARGGRLVLHGFASAAGGGGGPLAALRTLAQVPWLRLNPISLMNDNKSIGGVNLARMWGETERMQAWMERLVDLLDAGEITPRIDQVLPAHEAGAAQQRLLTRQNVGKVLLDFREEGRR